MLVADLRLSLRCLNVIVATSVSKVLANDPLFDACRQAAVFQKLYQQLALAKFFQTVS